MISYFTLIMMCAYACFCGWIIRMLFEDYHSTKVSENSYARANHCVLCGVVISEDRQCCGQCMKEIRKE